MRWPCTVALSHGGLGRRAGDSRKALDAAFPESQLNYDFLQVRNTLAAAVQAAAAPLRGGGGSASCPGLTLAHGSLGRALEWLGLILPRDTS